MGVYISEINMPKGDGSKLVLQIFPNGEVYDGHGIRLGITNWAEAVPVPPHGRLIDADAFAAKYIAALPGGIDDLIDKSRAPEFVSRIQALLMDIAEAPTIIPAEGGADR